MTSKSTILNNLRSGTRPFTDVHLSKPDSYLPMTPIADISIEAVTERFIKEAEALAAIIHQPANASDALEVVLDLIAGQGAVARWDDNKLPIPGVNEAMVAAGIETAAVDDPSIEYGLSGVDAGLAATGTLILNSGAGRHRATSLLPPVHVAVIEAGQIRPNFEAWIAEQRADDLQAFRQSSNIIAISGASRTADIAMELVMGMHGPRELHIVIVP